MKNVDIWLWLFVNASENVTMLVRGCKSTENNVTLQQSRRLQLAVDVPVSASSREK